MLAKHLKGYGIFLYIFKGIRDTWINFRDIGIQSFLNFGDICHISFRDMRYKGVWDTGTPPPFHGFKNADCVFA